MADPITTPQPNIAETLAREMAKPVVVERTVDLLHIAVPKAFELKEVDTEKLLPNPRRMRLQPSFATHGSFLDYIARHRSDATVVWCDFNPQTFALSFTAVLDDHAPGVPGWRGHAARFAPDFSAEWKAWKSMDGNAMNQIKFAEWIQEHGDDINSGAGGTMPTSLQMLDMATNFVMNEERSLKSAVRLQSGGTRLTYIADPDQGTVETMSMFERFAIGIPVFHGDPTAWSLIARLKYRNNSGKLSFYFELVRPDRVHQGAANELIGKVSEGLGSVPMLMGACK